jgi:Ca2+-binding EF-hand superfamily protein
MEYRRAIRAAVFASGFIVLLSACATGQGGPDEGGPSPGPGRGGLGRRPGEMRENAGWKQYDVNGDGKVTRAEFLAVRSLCFVRYDANEDGVLAPAEIRRRLPDRLAEGLGAALARLDRDRDGEVSREEFDHENDRLFRFLDTNGDGVIAGMELTALTPALPGDICQPSRSSEAGDGPGMRGPGGGPGPRGRP